MTYNEFDAQLSELKEVLAERLEYSKHWQQVRIRTMKTFMEIKWYNTKSDWYDPEGKVFFKITRIAPLNKDFMGEEIKRQKTKLAEDKRKYKPDVDDVG